MFIQFSEGTKILKTEVMKMMNMQTSMHRRNDLVDQFVDFEQK